MNEEGGGMKEGGCVCVSGLEVRRGWGMREEGGIHMRKNDCKLFYLEKIICFLKNLVEYIPVG